MYPTAAVQHGPELRSTSRAQGEVQIQNLRHGFVSVVLRDSGQSLPHAS